jgi:LmbE family N-acetylglucosaminyl deacetylase
MSRSVSGTSPLIVRPLFHGGPSDGSIVVISPHLDDAVLSLGASLARAARAGVAIEVLTVFGCDPVSEAPSAGWDRRAGFRTEGEAALARREEDRRACARLRVKPLWLPFGDADYERHGDASDIRRAVGSAVDGSATALLPGAPLTHPDHALLTEVLVEAPLSCRHLGLYVEPLYARRQGAREIEVKPPPWLETRIGSPVCFTPVALSLRDRLSKWHAVRAYRSQLPLLGLTQKAGMRLQWLVWRADEAVCWVDRHFRQRYGLG